MSAGDTCWVMYGILAALCMQARAQQVCNYKDIVKQRNSCATTVFMRNCRKLLLQEKPSAIAVCVLEKEFANITTLDVMHVDDFGYTPLMYAAEFGSIAMAEACLDRDANITAQDIYGCTALMKAAANHTPMVKFLLEYRDKYLSDYEEDTRDQWDKEGRTAYTYAIEHNNTQAAELLVQHGVRQQSISLTSPTISNRTSPSTYLETGDQERDASSSDEGE